MKTSFVTLLSSVLLLVGSATTAAPPQYPKAPGLTYLYQVNITGGEAAVVGNGPRGVQIVVPILFGSFEGPRLKDEFSVRRLGWEQMLTQDTTGKVLPMGGEWALLDGNNANGSLTNDVRQTFQTDDGAVIQIWETGQTQPDGSAYLSWAWRRKAKSTTGSTRSSPSGTFDGSRTAP